MADTKITALTALTAADPANDVIPIVDVSDTTMAASGTTKKISVNNILGASGTATLASATITGDLTVDTSTLKVDSTNNRVGIGTASPQDGFEVVGNSFFRGAAAGVRIGDGGGYGYISAYGPALSGAKDLVLQTGGGNVGVGVTPVAGSGAIQLNAGVGFPATQVASSNANCLDDYEEGTFTPTISSGVTGITFGIQIGTYTKVGRLVSFIIHITTTVAVRNGSPLIIAGLPFAAGNFTAGAIAYSNNGFIATAAGNKPNMYVSGTGIEFYNSDGTAFNGTTIAANSFDLRFSATYYV